ncbi:MAG: hypothetical protein AAGI01_08585 [Myxococcota bacterium]
MKTPSAAMTLLLALLGALLVSACSEDSADAPEQPVMLVDGPVDGDDPGRTTEGPPPLRTVSSSRRFFDDMPLQNTMRDPTFSTLGRELEWLAFSNRSFLRVVRQFVPGAPSRLPVLMAPRGPDTSPGALLISAAILRRAPMTASVWIGRGLDASNPPPPRVSIGGLSVDNPTSTEDSVTLQLDTESIFEAGGITWWRYSGTFSGFVGYGGMIIQDVANAPLYVQSPTIVPAETPATGALTVLKHRPMTANERYAFSTMTRMQRERSEDPLRNALPFGQPPVADSLELR